MKCNHSLVLQGHYQVWDVKTLQRTYIYLFAFDKLRKIYGGGMQDFNFTFFCYFAQPFSLILHFITLKFSGGRKCRIENFLWLALLETQICHWCKNLWQYFFGSKASPIVCLLWYMMLWAIYSTWQSVNNTHEIFLLLSLRTNAVGLMRPRVLEISCSVSEVAVAVRHTIGALLKVLSSPILP